MLSWLVYLELGNSPLFVYLLGSTGDILGPIKALTLGKGTEDLNSGNGGAHSFHSDLREERQNSLSVCLSVCWTNAGMLISLVSSPLSLQLMFISADCPLSLIHHLGLAASLSLCLSLVSPLFPLPYSSLK